MTTERERMLRRRQARAARLKTITRLVPVFKTIKPAAYLLASSWEKQLRKNIQLNMAKGNNPLEPYVTGQKWELPSSEP